MHFAEPLYTFVKTLQLRFDETPNLESNINQGQAKAIAFIEQKQKEQK